MEHGLLNGRDRYQLISEINKHDKNCYFIKRKRKVTPVDMNLIFNHDETIQQSKISY
ncbi:hypothetical protein [Pseudobacillus wudalianchiensis]|uniref:hypothetical protein n=1 Tax=Pseudobacillus wudalianchiensis TaxID=1743143 RepID=UPI00159F1ED0|nr:hypothetical protein [Bacillus wudalianchiensis]